MGRRTSDLPDILRLNLPGLSRVDPNDKDALCLLWNIFSKCGTTIENGRRLENISWRLWNREVLADDWDQPRNLTLHQLGQLLDLVSSAAHPPAHSARRGQEVRSSPKAPSRPKPSPKLPPEGDHQQQQEQQEASRNQQQGQQQRRQPSAAEPARPRAPSLFQKTKKPSPMPAEKVYDDDDDALSSDFPSDTEDEDGSYEDEEDDPEDRQLSNKHRSGTSTSIVRGFDPAQVSVVNRSPNSVTNNSNDSHMSKAKPQAAQSKLSKAAVPREKMFFIESSPSDSEDQPHAADSVSTNDDSSGPRMFKGQQHKASSLSKSISSNRGQYEEAVEDDEDSDWDSVDDESDSSFDEQTVFVRDDEKQKKPLTKPSLLSSLFLNNADLVQQQQQKQRQKEKERAATAARKKQPSPLASSNLHNALNPTENLVNATAQTHAPPPAIALSPRTTRRNMLASELSESLRKNLLWERQQSNAYRISDPTTEEDQPSDDPASSGGGGLKKSHTSADISTFRSAQGTRLPRNKSAAILNDNVTGTWREDMDDSNVDFNYHARGW